ncbi:MAG: phage tail protein [Methanobacteriaceae archaeon]
MTKDIRVKITPDVVLDQLEELSSKIDELDGTTPKIKPDVDDNASEDLDNVQKKADDLDGLNPKIKPEVDDSEAISALDNIAQKASGLEAGIAGAVAAIGIEQMLQGGVSTAMDLDRAWRNWVGGLQQAGLGFDEAVAGADRFKAKLNELSAAGQSNDSLFKNIAGLVINLNNKVSDSTLEMTEKVVAGYEMLGGRSGATIYEMEKELKDFLATGSLGKMADTISSTADPEKWKGLLEGADTVEERIDVLNQMLAEEGIMGALNIDAPTKSLDELKALFDANMTDIGNTILSAAKPLIDFFKFIDEQTGGVSTMAIILGLLGLALIATGIAAFGAFSSLVLSAAAMLGVSTAGLGLIPILWGIASAVIAATWPIIAIVAAIALIVFAIQELGKYMGWWDDWGSMIESFQAGINRLWAAFSNNAQVKAFFEWLDGALKGLKEFLKPLNDALDSFWGNIFPPQTGEFDIVRSIIDIFGLFGESLGAIGQSLTLFWGIVTFVGTALSESILMPLQLIIGTIVPLLTFLMQFINILVQLATGQITFQQAVNQVWNAIKQLIISVLQNVANAVPGFINNMVNYFRGLPAKIMSAIQSLSGQFVSYFQNLASQAWNAVTSALGGGTSGDIDETLKTGYGLTSAQVINQYGLLDLDSAMDEIEKINKGISRRDDIRTV